MGLILIFLAQVFVGVARVRFQATPEQAAHTLVMAAAMAGLAALAMALAQHHIQQAAAVVLVVIQALAVLVEPQIIVQVKTVQQALAVLVAVALRAVTVGRVLASHVQVAEVV